MNPLVASDYLNQVFKYPINHISNGQLASGDSTDMCQTESMPLSCPFREKTVFRSVVFTQEHRIYDVYRPQQRTFGCGDKALSKTDADAKNPSIECDGLPKVTGNSFQDDHYFRTIFFPWLEQTLDKLDAYQSQFKGPRRDRQMIMWVREGLASSECRHLKSCFDAAISEDLSFLDFINNFQASLSINSKFVSKANLETLLRFRGAPLEKNLFQTWNMLLDSFYRVEMSARQANACQIKKILIRFMEQNSILLHMVLSYPDSLVFLRFDSSINKQKVLSYGCSDDEDDFYHLMCLIDFSLKRLRFLFGRTWELKAEKTGLETTHHQGERPKKPYHKPVRAHTPNSVASAPYQSHNQRPYQKPAPPAPSSQEENKRPSETPTLPAPSHGSKVRKLTPVANLFEKKDSSSSVTNAAPNPTSAYLPTIDDSIESRLTRVVFDTGNEVDTIFPYRLLKFATDVTFNSYQAGCFGGKNSVMCVGYGTLRFLAPTDNLSLEIVTLKGYFLSEEDSVGCDEICIGRCDMPLAPGLNPGANFPVVGTLKEFPSIPLGLDASIAATWTVTTASSLIRKINKVSNTTVELESLCNKVDIELGELRSLMTVERLLWKLHTRFGHPSQKSFKLTLEAHGLTVEADLLKELYSSCSVCQVKPKPAYPIVTLPKSNDQGINMCFQDLTEPTTLGFGGYRYISVIIDSYGYFSVSNCVNRTDAVLHLTRFLDSSPYINYVRVDNAAELNSDDVKTSLTKRGVGLQNAAPGAHQSMGKVERANRTIKDKITTLMIDLGIELRSELWPWFTTAAAEAINSTMNSNGYIPKDKRHEMLHPNETRAPIKKFGFGDLVYFQALREKKKKERERLPNGKRIGMFLSSEHSSNVTILGFQEERVVIWVTHMSQLSPANPERLGEFRRRLSYYLTSNELNDLREVIVNNEGDCADEKIHAYPYLATGADINLYSESSDDSTSSEEETAPTDLPSKRKGTKKAQPKKRVKRLMDEVIESPLHDKYHQNHPSIFSGAVQYENDVFVAVTKPEKNMITLSQVSPDGKLDNSKTVDIPYDTFYANSTPAIIQSDHTVKLLASVRKINGMGPKGSFHTKFGYIADDEAPASDIEQGIFDSADVNEWQSIIDNGVLGPKVPEAPGVVPRRTRFRRTYKLTAQNETKPKSRFLVCEPGKGFNPDFSTDVPQGWLRKMTIIAGLSKGWNAATIDVKTAFLLVPLPEDMDPIYIKLPRHLPEPIKALGYTEGSIHQLNKSLYGLQESPKLFNDFLASILESRGWTKLVHGVFVKDDHSAYIIAYVDDILCIAGDPEEHLKDIASILKCTEPIPVNTTSQRHIGQEITMIDRSFFFDVNGYIDAIPEFEEEINNLGASHRGKLSPLQNLPLVETDESSGHKVPVHHIHLYQRLIGTLNWLAVCHPAVACRSGELGSATHHPTAQAFKVAKGVLHELRTEGLSPLEIVSVTQPELRLWVDCAVRDHNGRRGWVLQIADSSWPLEDRRNLIAWRSTKDRMKHFSSTAGEVNAIHQALHDIDDHVYLTSMLFPSARMRILSDSMSGILQIQNGGATIVGKERSKYIKYLLNTLPLPHSGLEHVSGLIQLADPLTKVKQLNWFDIYTNLLRK